MRVFIEFMPCLGDLVTELPILHALHEKIHPLDVEVSVQEPFAGLLDDYDWIGRRHVRGAAWTSRMSPFAASFREPFDLLLYLRSNPAIKLTRLFMRARRKLGAEAYDDSKSIEGVVPHRFSLVRHLLSDVPSEIPTRIVLRPGRMPEALAAAGFAEGARLLCLGPGASTPRRRWPLQRFGELARALGNQFDGIVVLGSPAESEMCGELARQAGGVSLAGQPLCLVAALLASSALYLGNDSGLSHLAAAQGCSAVTIGLESRAYYTPWGGASVPGRLDDLSAPDVLAFLDENLPGSATPAIGRGAGVAPQAPVAG